jgi:hypothetical protein
MWLGTAFTKEESPLVNRMHCAQLPRMSLFFTQEDCFLANWYVYVLSEKANKRDKRTNLQN